jgi:hypothetical protein
MIKVAEVTVASVYGSISREAASFLGKRFRRRGEFRILGSGVPLPFVSGWPGCV